MAKSARKTVLLLLALSLSLFAFVGCSAKQDGNQQAADQPKADQPKADQPKADDNRTIKVGFPAPLSGTQAGVGSDMEKGITLAMEEINAAGGVLGHKLELIKGDVEGQEPSTVTTVVRRLITKDKVDIMVTGYANPSLVEMELMQQNKMPYILYGYAQAQEAAVPKNPEKYSYIHNAIPSYKNYQTKFPEIVAQLEKDGKFKPENHKVAVIKSQNAYSLYCGDGMKDTFKQLGWDVVVDETIPFTRFTEFEPILNKIREQKPAVILYTDHTAANAATFLTSFLQNPTPSLLFLQATPSYPDFQKIVNGKQEGVIWDYAASLLGDKAKEFNAKYEKRWNEKPNPYGGFVYDAMMLAADAMKKSGDPFNKEAVNNILNGADYSYQGVIGTYKFDPRTHLALSGEGGIPFVTYQEEGGQHVVIDPSDLATGQFKLPPWYEAALKK
ncbi:ABC transporter substrate-binding protein [Ferviditalea candida]|uniref:ABC transporter substrate-binding protein n=1 Tax=Ferviditalea candida TaxID=3108399 RepID=A0ABU5ZEA0_9BACL|nr:ABC transporter substrate-binding protein [Paenibacillaceae bacterium T2]